MRSVGSPQISRVASASKRSDSTPEELEHHVHERTTELRRLNTLLQTEVAERRQAEQALRESEERYRIVSQSTSDYAFSFHFSATGTLVLDWLTDSFTKITGYTVEEARNHPNPLDLYIHPDDLERVTTTITGLPPDQPYVSASYCDSTRRGPLAAILHVGYRQCTG